MPAAKDPHPRLKDGFLDAIGGVNSDREPEAIGPNQLAFAVNVTLRDGFPETRPGFIPHTNDLDFIDPTIKDWWASHVYQGSTSFKPANGPTLLICSVGGRIFSVSPQQGYMVREITPIGSTTLSSAQTSPAIGGTVLWPVVNAADIVVGLSVTIGDGKYEVTARMNNTLELLNMDATAGVVLAPGTPVLFIDMNPSTRPIVWYEAVEQFLIIQDGQSPTIISTGYSSRRRTADEVPVGKMMKYHQGRLHVAVDGNQVAIGDIVSTTDNSAALKFTEEKVLGGFGRIRVNGEITALVEMAVLDASLGQGALQIVTKDGFTSINLPQNRDLWNNLTYAVQTISVKAFGALGQNGTVIINGDCFYRAKNGLRSFTMARRQFGGWGNTPVSSELSRITDDEVVELLQYSSTVLFNDRLLFTMQPQRTLQNAYFQSIGVLDFDPIKSMFQKAQPIYDGIWTGILPYQLVVGDFDIERCFAFTKESGGIGLWEISTNNKFDGDSERIPCWIEYPAFRFNKPFEFKKLQSAKVYIAQIIGTVDFTLRFRVDDSACWMEWSNRSRCALVSSCKSGDCYTMQRFKAGYKPHMGFGMPPDTCEEYDGKNARFGYQWQLRLEWLGHAQIKRIICTADGEQSQVIGNEDQDDT